MSETKGRCRIEADSHRKPEFHYAAIADAIDRLAADVAEVKEAVCGNRITVEETKKIQSDMEWVNKHEQWRREERDAARMERDAAIRERDEARAEVERLKAELAADVAAIKEMTREIALRVPSEFGEDACDVAVRAALKERDAAIRERDEARAIAADVAAVKAKIDAISPEGVAHLVECEKAWVRLVEDQRDAAVRERNEARALLELAQVQRTAAYADRDEARAEVYQLKCSTTETIKERDAAVRERDEWKEEARLAVVNRDEARAEVERLRAELDDREQTEQVERMREENEILHRASLNYIHDRDQYRRERDEARAEVERLKADGKQAPDDLGVLQDARGLSERCKELASRIAMQQIEARAEKVKAELEQQTPTAPQPATPPAGWLTEEERELLQSRLHALRAYLRSLCKPAPGSVTREVKIIDALLARAGSPSVVEVPATCPSAYGFDSPFANGQYRAGYREACLVHRAAIRAVGHQWKEVGRE